MDAGTIMGWCSVIFAVGAILAEGISIWLSLLAIEKKLDQIIQRHTQPGTIYHLSVSPPSYEAVSPPSYEAVSPPSYEAVSPPSYEVVSPPAYEAVSPPVCDVVDSAT